MHSFVIGGKTGGRAQVFDVPASDAESACGWVQVFDVSTFDVTMSNTVLRYDVFRVFFFCTGGQSVEGEGCSRV